MSPRAVRTTVLILTTSIGLLGCQNTASNQEPGIFSGVAGSAAGQMARATGSPTDTLVAGAGASNLASATVVVIAKRQASAKQRKIAEERAKAFQARLTVEKKTEMKKKRVRYIAVDTVKDERTSPKAKKDVMIWDVEREMIVGNNVYDVENTPSVGQTAKFDTYAAEYVGTGI